MITRVLILLVSGMLLAACARDEKAPSTTPVCLNHKVSGELETAVCALYEAFPLSEGDEKPSEQFLNFFTEDLRKDLQEVESVQEILFDYDNLNLDYVSNFRIRTHHAKSQKTMVSFTLFDDVKDELFLTLRLEDSIWKISDIRYDSATDDSRYKGYTLRQALAPLTPDDDALRHGYMRAIDRYEFLSYNIQRWANKMPDSKYKAMIKESEKLLNVLNEGIDSVIGPLEVEGFSRGSHNNLTPCEYDDPICRNPDGVWLSTENPHILLTTRTLLHKYMEWSTPKDIIDSDVYRVLAANNAAFDPMFDLVNPKPEGLDFFILKAGIFTNGGFAHAPPNAVIFAAAKGEHVFLGIHYLPEKELTDIPACLGVYEKTSKTEDGKGTAAYNACFGEKFIDHPHYPTLLTQLTSVVEKLATAR